MATRLRGDKAPPVIFGAALASILAVFYLTILPMLDGRAWPRFEVQLELVLFHV